MSDGLNDADRYRKEIHDLEVAATLLSDAIQNIKDPIFPLHPDVLEIVNDIIRLENVKLVFIKKEK